MKKPVFRSTTKAIQTATPQHIRLQGLLVKKRQEEKQYHATPRQAGLIIHRLILGTDESEGLFSRWLLDPCSFSLK